MVQVYTIYCRSVSAVGQKNTYTYTYTSPATCRNTTTTTTTTTTTHAHLEPGLLFCRSRRRFLLSSPLHRRKRNCVDDGSSSTGVRPRVRWMPRGSRRHHTAAVNNAPTGFKSAHGLAPHRLSSFVSVAILHRRFFLKKKLYRCCSCSSPTSPPLYPAARFRSCLDVPKNSKLYKIFHHIEFYGV